MNGEVRATPISAQGLLVSLAQGPLLAILGGLSYSDGIESGSVTCKAVPKLLSLYNPSTEPWFNSIKQK